MLDWHLPGHALLYQSLLNSTELSRRVKTLMICAFCQDNLLTKRPAKRNTSRFAHLHRKFEAKIFNFVVFNPC